VYAFRLKAMMLSTVSERARSGEAGGGTATTARAASPSADITEFEVRQTVAAISESPEPPLRKVRLLLRVLQRVRAYGRRLDFLSRAARDSRDAKAKAHLKRLAENTSRLHDEVRAEAYSTLRGGK